MDAKFRNKIISAVRRLTFSWKPIQEVKKRAKKAPATYECEECQEWCYDGTSKANFDKLKEEFPSETIKMEKVNVDHIIPVNSLEFGFIDWNTFINNMFCEEENLKVMCKTCHKIKTKEETAERKRFRDERKKNAKPT